MVVIKTGFTRIDPVTGFGVGDPSEITFLFYGWGDRRFASDSFAYEYKHGAEDYAFYRKDSPWWNFLNLEMFRNNWNARTSFGGFTDHRYVVYDIEDHRTGKELQERKILKTWGTLVRAIDGNAKVKVIKGNAGYAIKGDEITDYTSMEEPLDSRDDQGRITRQVKKITYETVQGKGIVQTIIYGGINPLGPNVSHDYKLTLVNGEFEDEIRLNVWKEGARHWFRMVPVHYPHCSVVYSFNYWAFV